MKNFLFYAVVSMVAAISVVLTLYFLHLTILNKGLPVGTISADFIKKADKDAVNIMLANGIDMNAKDKEGNLLFARMAAENPNPEVLSLLLGSGASLWEKNADGFSPVIYAAASNPNPEVIEILVQNGGNVNAVDYMGRSALMWAIKENPNPKVAEKILDMGAIPWAKDNAGRTVMDYVVQRKDMQFSDFHNKVVKKYLAGRR